MFCFVFLFLNIINGKEKKAQIDFYSNHLVYSYIYFYPRTGAAAVHRVLLKDDVMNISYPRVAISMYGVEYDAMLDRTDPKS